MWKLWWLYSCNCKNSTVNKYVERIGVLFEEKFGHKASFYVTATGDGGKEIYC